MTGERSLVNVQCYRAEKTIVREIKFASMRDPWTSCVGIRGYLIRYILSIHKN
jgi:hypothetical protein